MRGASSLVAREMAASGLLRTVPGWLRFEHRDVPRRVARGEPIRRTEQVGLGAALVWRSLLQGDVLMQASGLSYALVFSLVPLLTTTLAFFTAFAGVRDQRERMLDLVFSQLLPSAVSDVRTYIAEFSERAAAAGAISSLLFVLFILLLFNSVESTVNQIWKVERGRTWGQRLQALALFMIAGALAIVALIELRAMASAVVDRMNGGHPTLSRIAIELGNIAVACAVFVLANRVLPNTAVRWGPALLGGVITGVVWHWVKGGFTLYVENVASYDNIYGVVGTVPAFFLWVWLTLFLLLVGAHIAFVAQNFRALLLKRATTDEDSAQAFYGVAVLATLDRAFRSGESPLSTVEIAERLGVAKYFVSEAITRLSLRGLVVSVSSSAECRYAIARSGDGITVQDVVSEMSGEDLVVPEGTGRSELHDRIARLFEEARRPDRNVLSSVSVGSL